MMSEQGKDTLRLYYGGATVTRVLRLDLVRRRVRVQVEHGPKWWGPVAHVYGRMYLSGAGTVVLSDAQVVEELTRLAKIVRLPPEASKEALQ